MVNREILYIKLLDEGTDCWRPTFGEKIQEGIYKVIPTENYDPEIEVWEFLPGTIVYCEKQTKTSDKGEREEVLVAVKKFS